MKYVAKIIKDITLFNYIVRAAAGGAAIRLQKVKLIHYTELNRIQVLKK